MPIIASELLFKLSTTAGTTGNTLTSTPAASLGKNVSTTVVSTAINGIFDDISGAENAASTVDYRCIFVHNSNGSLPLTNAVVWLTSQVANGATVEIGLDPTAPTAVGLNGTQAVTIANETTAPAGVTFSSAAVSRATGLSIGTLGAGQVKGIWLKRTAANSAALNNDGVTINVGGDTAA